MQGWGEETEVWHDTPSVCEEFSVNPHLYQHTVKEILLSFFDTILFPFLPVV